jgi:mRNA interferase MazF
MQKDFDSWNIEKKLTERSDKQVVFYEREVWWYIAGLNIGVEIDGKHEFFLRPCVILRKFNKDMILVVPTTTQDRNNKYYYKVAGTGGKNYNTCLSQIRTISSKRLFRKIDTINVEYYNLLLSKVSDMVKGCL